MIELGRQPPERDATIVARMRAAGAIPARQDELFRRWRKRGVTERAPWADAASPYDAPRSPAGSSGGEAAAIAAASRPADRVSDSGGSRACRPLLRIATPKPTAGRIPLTGVLDEDGQIGPMSDPRTATGTDGPTPGEISAPCCRSSPDPTASTAAPYLCRTGDLPRRAARSRVGRCTDPTAAAPRGRQSQRVVREAAEALREGRRRRRGGRSPAGRRRARPSASGIPTATRRRIRASRILGDGCGYRTDGARGPERYAVLILAPVAPDRHRSRGPLATWSAQYDRRTA